MEKSTKAQMEMGHNKMRIEGLISLFITTVSSTHLPKNPSLFIEFLTQIVQIVYLEKKFIKLFFNPN